MLWLIQKLIHALRAGFKPISSNRAARQRGPRSPPTTNAHLHFLSKLLVHSAGADPVFLELFWETKTIIKLFQRPLKMQYKLALLPPSKYTKILIYKHLGIHTKLLGLCKSLCSEQGQNLRKIWRVPQYFVSVESVANENPSELRGFYCPHQSIKWSFFSVVSSQFFH